MPPEAAIGGAVGLGAIGSVIGGSMESNAAQRAAQQQADAARYAADIQYKMYQQQRDDQSPWRSAGMDALNQLGNGDFQRDFTAADFQKDPGYDFRMGEGQKALERSAAARGGLQSGGTMKAIARYGQDYASNEYNNAYNRFNSDRDRRFNRLSSVAGLGQTATNQLGQAGMNYANQAGQSAMDVGNAFAASKIGQANAWSGALGGVGQAGMNYALMDMLNKK